MKSILCTKYGPPSELEYKESEKPTIKANQILVRVHACSVNFPDTLIIRGLYQFKPDPPFSPGSDISGVVEEVGAEVKNYIVGDEVIGMSPWGGFAEYAAIDEHFAMPKPKEIPFDKAACFLYTYSTSLYALQNRAQIKSGESLLVLGASGGVGLAAVKLGKLLGAKVIAAASTDEKLALCKEAGAYQIVNYNTEDLKNRVKEMTDGKGVDVILDPVGASYANPAIRTMAWGGRYLVIGFAAGEIPKIPLNLPLLKGCSIVGVFLGSFAMRSPKQAGLLKQQLVDWYKEGKIDPYIHQRFRLEEAPKAIQMMMDRKAMGKLVVEIF